MSALSSGLNFFTNEIDKTPATLSTWIDVDVSGDGVPAGATGVILRLYGGGGYTCAVRKNGSTDTRTPKPLFYTGAMVGIDANRIFEAYVDNAACKVYLIGYTTDGTDFLTNSVDKTPATTGSWVDVDVSANVPSGAMGVIVQLVDTSGTIYSGGVRKNASTDALTYGQVGDGYANKACYQVCGVDANRIFEAQIENTALKVWLVGYFMPPISFETNAVSYALGSTGAWTDITVSGAPSGADGALWLVKNSETAYDQSGGTRKNGSSDESYQLMRRTICISFFTGLDGSKIAEGKISSTNVDHYVIGYAKPAGATQKTVTDALALNDAISVAVQKLVTDALALAETLSLKGFVSLTQGLNLSDALGTTARLTVADALALAEMVSPKQFKSIADSLAVADQVAAAVLVVRLLVLASLLKEGLEMSGTAGPALTLSAISGRGLQLESTMKGG